MYNKFYSDKKNSFILIKKTDTKNLSLTLPFSIKVLLIAAPSTLTTETDHQLQKPNRCKRARNIDVIENTRPHTVPKHDNNSQSTTRKVMLDETSQKKCIHGKGKP